MKKINFMLMAVAAVCANMTRSAADTCAPIRVDTLPARNQNWLTVFTNQVTLRWYWPAAASSAELKIVGMRETVAENFAPGVSVYQWQLFEGERPKSEEVYDLTLTFRDQLAEPVEVLTAKVAVLAGAFDAAKVDPGESERLWSRVLNNVVIPYDAAWIPETRGAVSAQIEIAKEGGASQTYSFSDTAGYFGWKLQASGWGFGAFDLALDFPGIEDGWQASLNYVPSTMVIRIR